MKNHHIYIDTESGHIIGSMVSSSNGYHEGRAFVSLSQLITLFITGGQHWSTYERVEFTRHGIAIVDSGWKLEMVRTSVELRALLL
jgi:hypothetical protein